MNNNAQEFYGAQITRIWGKNRTNQPYLRWHNVTQYYDMYDMNRTDDTLAVTLSLLLQRVWDMLLTPHRPQAYTSIATCSSYTRLSWWSLYMMIVLTCLNVEAPTLSTSWAAEVATCRCSTQLAANWSVNLCRFTCVKRKKHAVHCRVDHSVLCSASGMKLLRSHVSTTPMTARCATCITTAYTPLKWQRCVTSPDRNMIICQDCPARPTLIPLSLLYTFVHFNGV